jgi:hypothetical protein
MRTHWVVCAFNWGVSKLAKAAVHIAAAAGRKDFMIRSWFSVIDVIEAKFGAIR